MTSRPEGKDPPVALHRPQLRPVIEPLEIPSLWGPLRIYRGTLDEVWTIMSTVVDHLVLRVRIGGRDFEGDSLDALDEQREAVIEELEIAARDDWYGIKIQRSGWLAFAAVPRCGSTAKPEQREAMRQVMHALRATRQRSWLATPISLAILFLAAAVGGGFYTARLGVPFPWDALATSFVSGWLVWPAMYFLVPHARLTEIHVGYRQQYPKWWSRHRGQVFALVLVLVGAVVGAILTVVFGHVIH